MPPVSPASTRRIASLSIGRSTVPPDTSSSGGERVDLVAARLRPRGDAVALHVRADEAVAVAAPDLADADVGVEREDGCLGLRFVGMRGT